MRRAVLMLMVAAVMAATVVGSSIPVFAQPEAQSSGLIKGVGPEPIVGTAIAIDDVMTPGASNNSPFLR
jgi:hypothetical protein